jgi:hypothetical protein
VFVNKTPHSITVQTVDGTMTIEPTFPPARVGQDYLPAGEVDGIPVQQSVFGEVENLPEPEEGVVIIVSAMVAQQCVNRTDVVAPDTGASAIRDEAGRIVAVRGFVRY